MRFLKASVGKSVIRRGLPVERGNDLPRENLWPQILV
jgi:hypothetical protein